MSRAGRLAGVRASMVGNHLDALIITSLPNVRWLTGFTGSNAIAVVDQRDLLLLTDFRYRAQAEAEAGAHSRIGIEKTSLWDGVWPALTPAPVVGFESAHISHRDFERLRERDGDRSWRPTIDVVEALRIVKDDHEIECIRKAGSIATQALSVTIAELKGGESERSICGRLERALRELGSEAHPFAPIVASGERTALPHARASLRTVGNGDFLLMDFGATVGGYCSDITRTFVLGAASPRQRDLYAVVRNAQAAALDGITAGMPGREADALARKVIDAAGYGEEFGHGLGHGIGLEVHEAPRLSRLTEAAIPAGAVVTVEPGVYVPGCGGVRIEDDVAVRDGGVILLTDFTRELVELELRV
ncbi:MAG: M24 family metallopeptidase [Gemmatimonadota bacterium]